MNWTTPWNQTHFWILVFPRIVPILAHSALPRLDSRGSAASADLALGRHTSGLWWPLQCPGGDIGHTGTLSQLTLCELCRRVIREQESEILVTAFVGGWYWAIGEECMQQPALSGTSRSPVTKIRLNQRERGCSVLRHRLYHNFQLPPKNNNRKNVDYNFSFCTLR